MLCEEDNYTGLHFLANDEEDRQEGCKFSPKRSTVMNVTNQIWTHVAPCYLQLLCPPLHA